MSFLIISLMKCTTSSALTVLRLNSLKALEKMRAKVRRHFKAVGGKLTDRPTRVVLTLLRECLLNQQNVLLQSTILTVSAGGTCRRFFLISEVTHSGREVLGLLLSGQQSTTKC
ncbi:hypothetical protein SprV_0501969600 [Sparganum proliferum]